MAGELDDGDLHAQTDAQEGDLLFSGVADGHDLALDAAPAEAARHQHAIHISDHLLARAALQSLGIHAHDLYAAVVCGAGVGEAFVDGFVGVLQGDVLADHGDSHAVRGVDDAPHKLLPLVHPGLGGRDSQNLGDDAVHAVASQVDRAFVDGVTDVCKGHDVIRRHIAEHAYLFLFLIRQVVHFRAAHDDVGHDADFTQFGHALLGRLGFGLARRFDVGQQSDVDEAAVLPPHFQRKLAQRFQEEIPFDVSHRAADFRDDDVALLVFLREIVKPLLDFVGHVRDVLHRFAQIISSPLLFQHVLEHLAARQVVEPRELAVHKAFIMPQIQVGLRPIVEHVHFAVLLWVHGAGVDVQIRVELLHCHVQSAMFQQSAYGRRRQSFAQG